MTTSSEPVYDFDLDPVSFITVGTEGPPGQRTFYLQASRVREVVSLVIEKEQAIALATSIYRLLAEASFDDAQATDSSGTNMDLLIPLTAEFRIVEMGLGIDEDARTIILLALEAPADEPGLSARFVASYDHMYRLARHTMSVVEQGRPVCPLCSRPMDPDGHFCPRTNGHATSSD